MKKIKESIITKKLQRLNLQNGLMNKRILCGVIAFVMLFTCAGACFAETMADTVTGTTVTETTITETIPEQSAPTSTKKDYSALSAPEQAIMELFEKNETMSADEIASHGFKVDDVLSSLTMLEIYGYLKALPGGRYEIVDK